MQWWQQLFTKKPLEQLLEEAAGDNRLRRVLGPIGLTSLGIGAIIGAGIFVMTGRGAAQYAGPGIMISYIVAGIGCVFAALCYSEFASMAPVAGSAYTYAYTTLGELLAWIIGWDLILEYAMACAVVASSWTNYFNAFLNAWGLPQVPSFLVGDPFSNPGAWLNLPALLITLLVTVILVIGIKESANTNAILVAIKVGVVLFVIFTGMFFVNPANWTTIPPSERRRPQEVLAKEFTQNFRKEIETIVSNLSKTPAEDNLKNTLGMEVQRKIWGEAGAYNPDSPNEWQKKADERSSLLINQVRALFYQQSMQKEGLSSDVVTNRLIGLRQKRLKAEITAQWNERKIEKDQAQAKIAAVQVEKTTDLPVSPEDKQIAQQILNLVETKAPDKATESWGLAGTIGINKSLEAIDDRLRSPFMPYGLSGIVFCASLVFFAYIGFDSISTHAEEARNPKRDVPLGILGSLAICTILYIAVSAVITGMIPYPDIDPHAAVATAFIQKSMETDNRLLRWAGGLVAAGGLAGMTSVLLITFLSQARVFLAMARDGLLPPAIFGAIHPKFKTPHISTILTGVTISFVAAFTPIADLELMVNIGTLMAFVIVCASVFLLRFQNPNAERPFRCPWIAFVAPAGILVNLMMMIFLPRLTWLRLLIWLGIGLMIYFSFGIWNSTLRTSPYLKRLHPKEVN